MAKSKRIILDYAPETMDSIDALQDKLGLKSKANLIRYALGLLDLVSERKSEGYELMFRKGEKTVSVCLPMSTPTIKYNRRKSNANTK